MINKMDTWVLLVQHYRTTDQVDPTGSAVWWVEMEAELIDRANQFSSQSTDFRNQQKTRRKLWLTMVHFGRRQAEHWIQAVADGAQMKEKVKSVKKAQVLLITELITDLIHIGFRRDK